MEPEQMELLTFKTEQTETGRMATVTILDDGKEQVRQMSYDEAVWFLHEMKLEERSQKPQERLSFEKSIKARLK
jgi:hypothetical protein